MPTIASLSGLKFTQIDVTGLPGREITVTAKVSAPDGFARIQFPPRSRYGHRVQDPDL